MKHARKSGAKKRPAKKKADATRPRNVAMVSELKAGLSRYLEQVKRGEQIVVTERGRTIAKIVPVPISEDDQMARMRDMERRGLIIINGDGRIPPEYWKLDLPKDPEGLVLKALLEERDEGR